MSTSNPDSVVPGIRSRLTTLAALLSIVLVGAAAQCRPATPNSR